MNARTYCSRWSRVLFVASLCLLLVAGCKGGVNYTIGPDDLLTEGDMFDRYFDFYNLSPGAPEPEEQSPRPAGESPLQRHRLVEIGRLELAEVTLEEGVRRLRAAAPGCPPVVIVPDAIKVAGDKRVSLELRNVSLELALSRFLELFDAGLFYVLQDEALVIALKGSLKPVITGAGT